MAKKKEPVDRPVISLLTGREPNPIVAKAKASLAKRFRPTRSEAIEDGVIIAWYLVALGRNTEAAALASAIAAIHYTGNETVWAAAADARCLAARLARMAGKKKPAAAFIRPIVENPAFAESSRRDFNRWIADAECDLADGRAEKSATWARTAAFCALQRACYFRETAGHGFYYDTWVDGAKLDRTVDGALELMRMRLA